MNLDLDAAIDNWLAARLQWLAGKSADKLDRFNIASRVLYAAFAEDWKGDEDSLVSGFEQFRKSLMEDRCWTDRYLQVAPIYPHRTK